MAELIPGISQYTSSIGTGPTMTLLVNIFQYGVVFLAVMGIVFVIAMLFRHMMSFNIPVVLKYEVGESVIAKRHKMRIVKKGESQEVQIQGDPSLMGEVPADELAYFTQGKLRTIKMFEGFVRNKQIAWVKPKPQTVMIKQTVNQDTGEILKEELIETFITAPANLVRYLADRSRQNRELMLKLKWWQNPVLLSYAAIGFMIIAIVFIYLLYKNIPEQINGYISIVTQKCGQVLK